MFSKVFLCSPMVFLCFPMFSYDLLRFSNVSRRFSYVFLWFPYVLLYFLMLSYSSFQHYPLFSYGFLCGSYVFLGFPMFSMLISCLMFSYVCTWISYISLGFSNVFPCLYFPAFLDFRIFSRFSYEFLCFSMVFFIEKHGDSHYFCRSSENP